MTEAVQVEGVWKRFEGKPAVRDLSLSVPEGAVYGFIGPNGSGKTTTMRMILHIIHQDEGLIRVLGREGVRSANDDIAYLPEERGTYRKLTVKRQMTYAAKLKGMKGRAIGEAIDYWLERFALADRGNSKIEGLSKGMAQKVQFMSAILAQPKLLILDEPFSGLDPVNLEIIREAIFEMRDRGATVIFSTHDMGMAERLCDRIFMIYRGDKVLDGTLGEIRQQHGAKGVRLRVTEPDRLDLGALPLAEAPRRNGTDFELMPSNDPQAVLEAVLQQRARVEAFEIVTPSLHDIFVRIARPTREEEATLTAEGVVAGSNGQEVSP